MVKAKEEMGGTRPTGAVWQAGGVTLHHNDALVVMRALGDSSVDLVLTDPPYGHCTADNHDLISRVRHALGRVAPDAEEHRRPIANDGVEADGLYRAMLIEAARVLVPGGVICCCCSGGGSGLDQQYARWTLWMSGTPGLEFIQMVIWDKGSMGLGWRYRRSWEAVLVAQKKGAPYKWYDRSSRVENIIRPGAYGIRKIIPSADDHPTPKPWQLGAFFIRLHTQAGDIVLDPFMGHGPFGEAAVRESRNFIGVELSGEYFRVAQKRIAEAQSQLHIPFAPTSESDGSSHKGAVGFQHSLPNPQSDGPDSSARYEDASSGQDQDDES